MPPKRGKKGKRRGDLSSDDEAATAAAAAVAASIKAATVDDSDDDGLQRSKKPESATVAVAPAKKVKGKKKGKGKGGRDKSDDDARDALDPLAHLKGGATRGGVLKGEADPDDEEERPKKPLTKKEKRRLEEEERRREMEAAEQDAEGDDNEDEEEGDVKAEKDEDEPEEPVMEMKALTECKKGKKKGKGKGGGGNHDDEGDVLDPLAHLKGGARKRGALKGEADPDDEEERPKESLTKKEKRRLEEEERRREMEAAQRGTKGEDVDENEEDEIVEKEEDEVDPEETSVNAKASKGSKKGKKGKGKGGRDEPGDDGDVLDPLAHLKGGAKRGGVLKGEADPDDVDERPKKPLTKKEKKRLEEEQRRREMEAQQNAEGEEEDEEDVDKPEDEDEPEKTVVETRTSKGSRAKKGKKGKEKGGGDDLYDDEGDVLDPLARLKGGSKRGGKGEADPDDEEERPKKPLTKEKRRLEEEERRRKMEAAQQNAEEEEEDVEKDEDEPEEPVVKTRASKGSKKGKKGKGKGGRDDLDDEGDVLNPLAHLKGGAKRGGALKGEADPNDEDERPKKPLTRKKQEEEQRRREMEGVDGDGEDKEEVGDDAEKDDDEPEKAAADARASKGSKKGKSKKGRGHKEDEKDDLSSQMESLSLNAEGGPSGKLAKKGRRRAAATTEAINQHEDGDGEAETAGAAAAAEGVNAEEARLDREKAAEKAKNKVEGEDGDGGGEEDDGSKRRMSKKEREKAKKQGKKERGKDNDGDAEADNDVEDELSRGVQALSVGGEVAEQTPSETTAKVSKERRRHEGNDKAEEDGEAAAVAEGETGFDKDKAPRKTVKKTAKSKTGVVEGEGEGGEHDDGEEDGGQKRRISKKERKKSKQEGSKKKGVKEEAPGLTHPEAATASGAAPSDAAELASPGLPLPPPSSSVSTAGNGQAATEQKGDDGGAAVVASAGSEAKAEEPKDAKKSKKEKKSKLMRKLEEAKRLKADTEAAAGVKPEDDAEEQQRDLAMKEAERKRKGEKEARKAKKEAAKKKEAKVKSILEDLDDAQYYGSDHDERDKKGATNGGAPEETVEEELARLVAKAEAGGKTATSRQRKKILQDIEARRRAAAEEQREELAHREGAQFGCSQTTVNATDQQWVNSLDITIEAFSISAHDKTLFKDSSLQVVHGRKYGLVGPNGAGKSTLLKMIASGELKIPPRIDCLYVEQEVVADETPAVIAVMKADKARWSLMEEERRVNRLLRDDPENEKLNERLQQVHEELHTSGGDGAEAQARRILFGLGFDDVMQVKATKHFSGGWRMRISLARALFMEPTLLMLDEPTNHLDLNAVIWLDDYLQKWKKTLLVVSHDQDFLNSVCEEILHLDSKRVVQYKGNYDQFKEMEAQKRRQQAKEWEKQQRKLAALKKGGQSKGKAEETIKKSKFREPGGSKKKKNDAVAAGTGEVETATLIERPREYIVTLHFPEVSNLSPPVIEVQDVDFKYDTGPMILKNVNFGLDQSSRICIVGPNGAGKTTLLKLLTGALEPTTGFIRRNPRMRAGIYNQHFVDRLPMDIDPTSYLRTKFSDQCDYQSARNLLGRFGLEGHAHTIKMRDLSGGQKARVVFCELSLQAPHVLFLDEPTNNLDIESIDALCTALTEFNGGVVVVTHDARLIEATECRLWIVDEQEVTPWQGEFDDYRADLLQKLEEKLAAQEQARADKASA